MLHVGECPKNSHVVNCTLNVIVQFFNLLLYELLTFNLILHLETQIFSLMYLEP